MHVFMSYINAVGRGISLIIIFLYTLNNAAQVGASFWLSAWADDPKPINGTVDKDLRNLRLGVYGAFGAAQGRINVLFLLFLPFYKNNCKFTDL